MKKEEPTYTKADRAALLNQRVRLGKKYVSLRACLFCWAVRSAIKEQDDKTALGLSITFFEQFKRCCDSGVADFFRDLAVCIEEKNDAERWLYERLFTKSKQTSHPKREDLLKELEEAGHPMSLRHMGRILTKLEASTKPTKKRSAIHS